MDSKNIIVNAEEFVNMFNKEDSYFEIELIPTFLEEAMHVLVENFESKRKNDIEVMTASYTFLRRLKIAFEHSIIESK